MRMNKRVYGVLGVSSIMANWNADFNGYPKTMTDGQVFGSDKAFKYPMKRMWNEQGEKVLYIKSLIQSEKNELKPRTLKERYEYIFDVKDLKKQKNIMEIVENLFQAIDVKNFGATFAEADANISITGAVQIGQGLNLYEDSEVQEQNILSPFRDPKAEDAKQSTLGTKIVSDEAHYFYPFVINPNVYQEYEKLQVTDGYNEEDYEKFKRTAVTATTAFATNAKVGCENEFGLFVETDADLYLPNLDRYIEFKKGEGKNQISIRGAELFTDLQDRIQKIEVYYNPYTTEVLGDICNAQYLNIITMKPIE